MKATRPRAVEEGAPMCAVACHSVSIDAVCGCVNKALSRCVMNDLVETKVSV